MISWDVDYKVNGYYNTWAVVDELTLISKGVEHTYVLLENTKYGDETCYLVLNKYTNVIEDEAGTFIILNELENTFETFDDIETCLNDEGILL